MQNNDKIRDEFSFRDLVGDPARMFGYAYPYILSLVLVTGAYYLWRINLTGVNAIQPAVLSDSSRFVRDIPLQAAVDLPPIDVMTAGKPSADAIAHGKQVYQSQCVSCHGDAGRGDGPSAAALNPKPRNFASPLGWRNGMKVADIYKTLQEGILGTGMASFKHLPPADLFAVTHYIRTLMSNPPTDTDQDLQSLEFAYQLSKGKKTPPQIPIAKAAGIVLKETESFRASVEASAKRAAVSNGEGAELYRSVVINDVRVFTAFKRLAPAQPNDFVRAVEADPKLFGFKSTINRLSTEEWSSLYNFLKNFAS